MSGRARSLLGLGLSLLLFALLSLWSASRESATFDEVPHLGGAYSHVALGDHRHDLGGEPPLMKMIAGLSVLTLHPPVPTGDPGWRGCNPTATCTFSTRFLYGNGDGRAILMRARLPFVLLGVLLGAVVFAWTREAFGDAAAGIAVALYALNPELLAHSHYVTSDLGITLFTVLFLWGTWKLADRPSPARVVGCAAAFALAAVTKFSFAALIPMGALLAGARLWPRREDRALLRSRLGALVLAFVAALPLTYLAIWAVYGFRAPEAASPDLTCDMTIETLLPDPTPARTLLTAVRDRAWLPEAYATGLALRINESGGAKPSFIAGQRLLGGRWYYFPLALLLKTPLPLLLLAAASLILLARPGARAGLAAVLLPAAFYLVVAMRLPMNIGYRHLLPVLPLLCIAGGCGGAELLADRGRLRWVAALLLAWQALGTLRVAPHFLSHFNELAGGAEDGSRWLADSNCDWGQDLEELARVCRERGYDRIKLSYFGNASPEAAGVPYTEALPSVTACWKPRAWAHAIRTGDVLAISLTNLRLVYMTDLSQYPYQVELSGTSGSMGYGHLLRYIDARYRPAAHAGYSIAIYQLTPEYER